MDFVFATSGDGVHFGYREKIELDLKQLMIDIYEKRSLVGVLPMSVSGPKEMYRKYFDVFQRLVDIGAIEAVVSSMSFLMEIRDWEKVISVLKES